MFIDKTRIYVRGGKGGDGCVSFRREKYVPYGGPNGGNGGRGGDVILRSTEQIKTLLDFYRAPHYAAENGSHGQGKNKTGRSGNNLILTVPVGTVVRVSDQVYDLITLGEEVTVAYGGRGGRGNAAFKTHDNTAPRISEKGAPGDEVTIDLELKLIAEVGLVGYPNAGKSSLLAAVSAAKPKIADYPFTTLSPNLGVCLFNDRAMVFADIPGLIEGASEGKGLGIEFLRHIERTRILIHVVDVFGYDNSTALENFVRINNELEKYSLKLKEKPMLVVANKLDLPGAELLAREFRKQVQRLGEYKVFTISAVKRTGINELLRGVSFTLSNLAETEQWQELESELTEQHIVAPEFSVTRENRTFIITGKKIERIVAMTNFNQPESVKRLQNIFVKLGIERALKIRNIREGDLVRVGKQEFTYTPNLTTDYTD